MNFGLDLRPSLSRPTGVGTYVLGLADRLPGARPRRPLPLLLGVAQGALPDRDWPRNVHLVDRRLPVRALNLAWNRLGWPPLDSGRRRRARPRALAPPSPHPRSPRPADRHHPRPVLPQAPGDDGRRRSGGTTRSWSAITCARADGVICVSEHTAAEARRLLDVPDGEDRGDPPRGGPRFPGAAGGRPGRRHPAQAPPAPGRDPVRGERREAQEPRLPGDGLPQPGRDDGPSLRP